MKNQTLSKCRLDLWLWSARFYKTRNLAVLNIKKGLVRLCGKTTTKPSSQLSVGSQIIIKQDFARKMILVKEIARKRVSSEKALAYYVTLSVQVEKTETVFQSRASYKQDKKVRRHSRALKGKLNFISHN